MLCFELRHVYSERQNDYAVVVKLGSHAGCNVMCTGVLWLCSVLRWFVQSMFVCFVGRSVGGACWRLYWVSLMIIMWSEVSVSAWVI